MSYDLIRIQQFLADKVQDLSGLCFVLENRIGPPYAYRKLPGPLEEDRSRALVAIAKQRDEVGELVLQTALYWLNNMNGRAAILLREKLHLDLMVYLQELEEFGGDPGKIQAAQKLFEQIDPAVKPPPVPTRPSTGGGAHQVFLSYCRRDSDMMQRVYESLTGAGFSVWVDQTSIPVGTPSWAVAIEQGIDNARCVVALLSPDAKVSKWVRAELDYAAAKSRKVLPVLVRGDDSNAVPLDYIRTERIDIRDLAAYDREIQKLIAEVKHYLGVP